MFIRKFFKGSKQELTELRQELYMEQQRNEVLMENYDFLMEKYDFLKKNYDSLMKDLSEAYEAIASHKNKISRPRKHEKIINVMLDVFKNAEKDLCLEEVMAAMDKRKLKKKKPDVGSIRSMIGYLMKKGHVKSGQSRGTYRLSKR